MSIRQHARERLFERQIAATAGLTGPVEESKRVDPSRDPRYPYDRARERQATLDADALTLEGAAHWERSKQDDFEPGTNVRLYVIEGVPMESGEGAIYTPEYLKRTGA